MNQQELSHTLRKEIIRQGRSVQIFASGYSMYPFLRKGDLLTVEPVSMDKIKRGDVVVFESDEKWIAHRVIKIRNKAEGFEFLLRGDTCIEFDPVVDKENYIGKVTAFSRNKKEVLLNDKHYKNWTFFILLSKNDYYNIRNVARRMKSIWARVWSLNR